MKIVESEVDFRVLHSNDWTNPDMQLDLKTPALPRATVNENFSSIRWVDTLLSTWPQKQQADETNMPPIIMKPKNPPGVSNIRLSQKLEVGLIELFEKEIRAELKEHETLK